MEGSTSRLELLKRVHYFSLHPQHLLSVWHTVSVQEMLVHVCAYSLFYSFSMYNNLQVIEVYNLMTVDTCTSIKPTIKAMNMIITPKVSLYPFVTPSQLLLAVILD